MAEKYEIKKRMACIVMQEKLFSLQEALGCCDLHESFNRGSKKFIWP